MMNKNIQKRTSLLNELLFLKRDLNQISQELKRFEWDSEEELVILDKDVLANLLNGFLTKNYSFDVLEDWANLVECREDIEYEEQNLELIKEILGALANKSISNPIDENIISSWLSKIK